MLLHTSELCKGLRSGWGCPGAARNMGGKIQALVEAVLKARARIESAQRANVNQQAPWDQMDAHGISQNEAARRAGISSAHLSRIMTGKATPVEGRSEAVARCPVQADEGRGAGGSRRDEGAGLEEGWTTRGGSVRVRRAGRWFHSGW